MMTYDSAVSVERNEIDFMLQSLQTDLSDGKNLWGFVIKQLSDVFAIIMVVRMDYPIKMLRRYLLILMYYRNCVIYAVL